MDYIKGQTLFSKDVYFIEFFRRIWNQDGMYVQIIVDPKTPNQSSMQSDVIAVGNKWSQALN